jgi:autotransporter passenger strand-loop-strand repeat protein
VDVTVSAGGELYVSGGGSAIDTMVIGTTNFTGQGSVTVFSGGMTTGTVIGSGSEFGPPEGVEYVLSGNSDAKRI